ncbi:MAG: hypothetical protein JEZ06_21925, partial [Anaerolineaceae bacterium]|nr:hypothetical protein [Anaerolineaceae bacterium]
TQYRTQIPKRYLAVNLYGDEGNIADGLMMGLRRSLESAGLADLLPESAFDSAIKRINEIEIGYPESYEILKQKIQQKGMTVDELRTRLGEYQKNTFDIFRKIHPAFSSGGKFEYSSMLDHSVFFESIVKDLRANHGYEGIAIFWDEFGHKMEEVVKDPTGKEGLALQDFAECCNNSQENQLHLYLFCHRSLKEYHDISKRVAVSDFQQLEDDLTKIEGRFKQYILKSSDVETFELIDGVVVGDELENGWKHLVSANELYFDNLVKNTARFKYFVGFNSDELRSKVVFGAYPLHPMAVYSLPVLSEKVAQNNRTLFTCLCEDEVGSFKRFLDRAVWNESDPVPPMFTVDQLWDYFQNDIKSQERTYSVYQGYERLRSRLDDDDSLGLRILKAVSVFQVTNPARVKVNNEMLAYALDIPIDQQETFVEALSHHSDLSNENYILIKLETDGSYRPAVSGSTQSLKIKVKKLIMDTPEKLVMAPVQYLKTLWSELPVNNECEATSYGDDFGVRRQLIIEPISMNQLRERLHILTKNIGTGSYQDGLILTVLCSTSSEIEEAKKIAAAELADSKHRQVVLAIPNEPVRLFDLIKQHQALSYLKNHEASLYAEGGDLNEEWNFWNADIFNQLSDTVGSLFSPEKQMLEYRWQGQVYEVKNSRQLKRLATQVMRDVFPYCPKIFEGRLAMDDLGGNWGYRAQCKDITLKLARPDAAETLWNETASALNQVITQVFKSNGMLYRNQAGDVVLEKPDEESHPGAFKVWDCMADYLVRARQRPVEIKNIVGKLRKPPFGLKCRVMPLFFAAVAHHELALGNISFEFQRNANQVEKITSFEADTIEKVFASPDKYRLVYINVSSNQNALINGLSKVFNVELIPADLALEKVKKVGAAVGEWWRNLPQHSQQTANISDGADVVRTHIFQPLASPEADVQQILLRDAFVNVFENSETVEVKRVKDIFEPIKMEFEDSLSKLKVSIQKEYISQFGGDEDDIGIATWFAALPKENQEYVFNAEPAILVNSCRENESIDEPVLFEMAEKMTGLSISSWNDDMVVKLGAKLDGAKKLVETFKPPEVSPPQSTPDPIAPGQARFALSMNGHDKQRIFEVAEALSPNAEVMENMLNATFDQIGRSLDEHEKIAVICRFVDRHVFGNGS